MDCKHEKFERLIACAIAVRVANTRREAAGKAMEADHG